MTAARTTAALIKNAVEAFQATGLKVGAVRVRAGGVVEIVAGSPDSVLPSPQNGGNSCDEVFGEVSD